VNPDVFLKDAMRNVPNNPITLREELESISSESFF